MRLAATFVALAAAATTFAVTAFAGTTAKNPLALVLQRADFPATTHWTAVRSTSADKTLAAAGFHGRAADYLAKIPRGSTETLFVSGRVIVLASAAEARRLFPQYKQDIALQLKLARAVRLGAYGDEQSAFVVSGPGTRADLRVRTGAIVWRVEIKWSGVKKLTRAVALAELQVYASKLKKRVGAG